MITKTDYSFEQNTWWEYYFLPFHFGGSKLSSPQPTGAAYLAPLLFYILTAWLVSFMILSNQMYHEYLFSVMEQRGSHNPEALEMARIGFEHLTENPLLCVLFAAFWTLKSIIILVFIVISLLSLRLVTTQTIRSSEIILTALLSSFPLTIANIIYGLLRLLLLLDDANIGLSLLIPAENRVGKIYEILNYYDLFSLWFIALFAYRVSKSYSEKYFTIFTISLFAYTIGLGIYHLINLDLFLTLFLSSWE